MKKEVPKITDGELKVLEALWEMEEAQASQLVALLKERAQWNRNTTYTFINRLVEKGIIERREPGFVCIPRYSREEVRVAEAKSFLNRMYEGSLKVLVTSFINNEVLSEEEINELKQLIEKKGE
ncbi:BlaI/MecI/CopY family transcriptional regulator [Alkaliphilus crotonatoxidans]